jgi:hypothetical protein
MPIATYNVNVPPSGDGALVDISVIVGAKTVVLTGFFTGSYTLLASHDNGEFVPVLLFNAGGQESIKQTLSSAYKSVRLRSNAGAVPASSVTCSISGVAKPGENLFADLVTFLPGGPTQSAIIDTATLFPPTGLEQEINIICAGSLVGDISVEGSLNGSDFNTLGIFQGSPPQRPLVGLPQVLEFSPLVTPDKVRYLRITLAGQVSSPASLTIGGRIPATGTVGTSSLVFLAEDDGRAAVENNSTSSTETILYEVETNLASAPAALTLQLNGITLMQGVNATGRFRVYVGATGPGDTAGSTLAVDSGNLTNQTEDTISVTGLPISHPGGKSLIQVTGVVSPPGLNNGTSAANLRGVTVVGF